MTQPDPAVLERLRRRYPPPRVSRPVKTLLVGIGVAIAVAWILWAGLTSARPPVAAQVTSYLATPGDIKVVFTVDRRDPAQPVTCHVIAQAADFQIVGEADVQVDGSPYRLVNVDQTITTVRRAVSASVKGCTV